MKEKMKIVGLGLLILSFLVTGCQQPEEIDLSQIRATQPPTRTPVPTSTAIPPEPTFSETAGDTSGNPESSDTGNSSNDDASLLISQLNKIYERLTGEEFDLNSEILTQIDGKVQTAIQKINDITISGGSPEEIDGIYENLIAELNEIGQVGTVEATLQDFASAGRSMTSPETQSLADALEGGDPVSIAAELDTLAGIVRDLPDEAVGPVVADMQSAAAELSESTENINGLLLDEEAIAVGGNIAGALNQAADALIEDDSISVLESLAKAKAIVDAIAANVELSNTISLTLDEVKRETQALRNLKTLLGQGRSVRISPVEIKMVQTSVELINSADILPSLEDDVAAEEICILGKNLTVYCMNNGQEWETPPPLNRFSGRTYAATSCNGQLVIGTEKELVRLENDQISTFAAEGYLFKPPSRLACDSKGQIWALPADTLADNPWVYDGTAWTLHNTILQNQMGVYGYDIEWGTKFEVNENSPQRENVYIDPLPFVSRQSVTSWDIYYNLNWESGLYGPWMDEGGELWFGGSGLYHLTTSQGWFGFEGEIGPAMTLLTNGMAIGNGAEAGTVRVFDKGRTWYQLEDWPSDVNPAVMTTAANGTVYAADGEMIVMWNGSAWETMTHPASDPIVLITVPQFSGVEASN